MKLPQAHLVTTTSSAVHTPQTVLIKPIDELTSILKRCRESVETAPQHAAEEMKKHGRPEFSARRLEERGAPKKEANKPEMTLMKSEASVCLYLTLLPIFNMRLSHPSYGVLKLTLQMTKINHSKSKGIGTTPCLCQQEAEREGKHPYLNANNNYRINQWPSEPNALDLINLVGIKPLGEVEMHISWVLVIRILKLKPCKKHPGLL